MDADLIDRLLAVLFWTRTTVIDGRRVIAIDGKTVRGARTGDRTPHLVAAYDHTSATVVGQVQAGAKTHEIPATRDLLAMLDLEGVVVTLDAMHTQTGTARVITRAGGDYVFTVKGNQCANRCFWCIPTVGARTSLRVSPTWV